MTKRTTVMSAAMIASALFVAPITSNATTLDVQTLGNSSNATAGTTGLTIAASALISVVATDLTTGLPVSNLGSNTGNGTTAITLPSGWSLFSNLNVPPGGCLLTPTQFINFGNGAYDIRVAQQSARAGCAWKLGDYHYVVFTSIGSYQGAGLGKITISH